MWVTSSLTKALTPTSVALGNFDGVHRGHQRVIQPILNIIKGQQSAVSYQLSAIAGEEQRTPDETSGATDRQQQTYTTVVTFNPHPREFFTGQPRALLTPLDEKVKQMECLGVEQLVLLPFDRELAALSPEEFVAKILVQQLRCQRVSVGEDFRFGRERSGTATELQAIAATYGVPVTIVPLQTCEGDRISSSAIRHSLCEGNLLQAEALLGRPYTLTGAVVKGQQLGRTIGFPTANLQLPPEKFLPRQGVYAVRVFCSTLASLSLPQLGVMNIGCRPTVNGTNPTVEVHLLDWSGDLYEQIVTVQLEKFLRPEQKFASLEALKAQIDCDCAAARAFLSAEY